MPVTSLVLEKMVPAPAITHPGISMTYHLTPTCLICLILCSRLVKSLTRSHHSFFSSWGCWARLPMSWSTAPRSSQTSPKNPFSQNFDQNQKLTTQDSLSNQRSKRKQNKRITLVGKSKVPPAASQGFCQRW